MGDATDAVKAAIPHREPFLFVDRLVEQAEGRIVTERAIRVDEPHFAGHYPGAPLMPGVLICEACFQSGAMLLASDAGLRPAALGDVGVSPAAGEVEVSWRGRLPHWERDGGTYFVTWRAADSLPAHVVEQIRAERADIIDTAAAMNRELSPDEHRRLEDLHTEKIERVLNSGYGACHLTDDRCAKVVADALRFFDGQRYELLAWCVMPNHVHVVFRAREGHSLSSIMHSWKSFTAKECNRILGRTGSFWMDESFDRLVRDEFEFRRFVRYTLENPSAAGLDDWPWVGAGAGGTPTPLAAEGQSPTPLVAAGQRPSPPTAAGQRPTPPTAAGQRPTPSTAASQRPTPSTAAGQRPTPPTAAGQRPTPSTAAGGRPTSRKPVLTRILEAKFRGMVRPGDVMRIEVEQEEKMGDAYVMNGRVDVAGKNVLRVKFIVAMVEVPV